MSMNQPFGPVALTDYLRKLHGGAVTGVRVTPLGGGRQGDKGYGYGIPLRVDFQLDGKPRRAVVESVRPGPFGHEHMADRAQSLADFVDGREYADDLLRLRAGEPLRDLDRGRAAALCDYLVEIHRVAGPDPGLYVRRIRELVGHGECIFGIADSYPPQGPVGREALESIEQRCVAWRWRLKGRSHRLRQVHGDFHPWNILFRDGTDFSVLDRSRGEWGEAADDLACLTLNYLFFSLQRAGRLEGDFERLFRDFWERYLERSGDREMLEVVAPFFAFRALVMANPLWYPALQDGVRSKLLRFIVAVLDAGRFEPGEANRYCGA